MLQWEGLARPVRGIARRDQHKYPIPHLVLKPQWEGLAHPVRGIARQYQQKKPQMGLSTQVQKCFRNEHRIISPRVSRGDEHLHRLAAPLLSGRHRLRARRAGTSETDEGSRSEVRGSGCEVPKTQHSALRTQNSELRLKRHGLWLAVVARQGSCPKIWCNIWGPVRTPLKRDVAKNIE